VALNFYSAVCWQRFAFGGLVGRSCQKFSFWSWVK
jgi:hypothetical protein